MWCFSKDQDWATPLGVLEVDHRALKQLLCAVPGVPVQRQVHATEHSIETLGAWSRFSRCRVTVWFGPVTRGTQLG